MQDKNQVLADLELEELADDATILDEVNGGVPAEILTFTKDSSHFAHFCEKDDD